VAVIVLVVVAVVMAAVVVVVLVVVVVVVVILVVAPPVAVAVTAVIPHITASNSHSSIPCNSSQSTSSQLGLKQAQITKTVAISFRDPQLNKQTNKGQHR
jgi:predicted PurR-regulated permease PerM